MSRSRILPWVVGLGVAAGSALASTGPAPQQLLPLGSSEAARLLATADRVVAELPPEALETLLVTSPVDGLRTLQLLGHALRLAEEPRRGQLQAHLSAVGRARSRRLTATGGAWPEEELDRLLALLLVDPSRFVADPEFQERVRPSMVHGLDPSTPAAERDRLLRRLNHVAGVGFRFSESIQLGWGRIPRSSQPLRRPFAPHELRPGDDVDGEISASIFAFPSRFFEPEPVLELLEAVHGLAPERILLVLADGPVREALSARVGELPLAVFDTFDRPFTPWVRDVLALRRDGAGRVVVVLRPETQVGREDDVHMGQVLLQNLSDELFAEWQPTWQPSGVPFHNGQILQTADAAWISIHSLKAPIRRLTGLPGPPAAGRNDAAIAGAYLEAARQAATTLEVLLGKPIRFVHDFGDPGRPQATFAELEGGAPHDLDSLLTLLPAAPGPRALVADLEGGRELVGSLGTAELAELASTYGLRVDGETLREHLDQAVGWPRAQTLQSFLDASARHLATTGVEVERLPLIWVPADLLAVPRVERDFLIGWHNVTLETRRGQLVADGFASGLERGDALAVAAFARAGYRLHLLPPLIESVVRSGGFRCLSNHLRAAPAG